MRQIMMEVFSACRTSLSGPHLFKVLSGHKKGALRPPEILCEGGFEEWSQGDLNSDPLHAMRKCFSEKACEE